MVFICAGNICRSSVALHAFRRALARQGSVAVETASYGLVASDGDVPCAETIRAAAAAGLDLREHVARRLHGALLRSEDDIYVMERAQVSALRAMAPPQACVSLLGGAGPDIEDPEGGDDAVFDACVTRIVACVEEMA